MPTSLTDDGADTMTSVAELVERGSTDDDDDDDEEELLEEDVEAKIDGGASF